MTTFIGERRDVRLTCGEEHLPGCYNPNCDQTWCMCGEVQWPGDVGLWTSTSRYGPDLARPSLGIGVGAVGLKSEAEFLGWDTFFMHAQHCPRRRQVEACVPHCEVRP
jgi:hypothetical protein